MPRKAADPSLDLFESNAAAGPGETRVWKFPDQLDWSAAGMNDLIQFPRIRNWEAPGTEAVYMEAVGRLKAKGRTGPESKRYVEVEILWDDAIPRLQPDRRVFLLD